MHLCDLSEEFHQFQVDFERPEVLRHLLIDWRRNVSNLSRPIRRITIWATFRQSSLVHRSTEQASPQEQLPKASFPRPAKIRVPRALVVKIEDQKHRCEIDRLVLTSLSSTGSERHLHLQFAQIGHCPQCHKSGSPKTWSLHRQRPLIRALYHKNTTGCQQLISVIHDAHTGKRSLRWDLPPDIGRTGVAVRVI